MPLRSRDGTGRGRQALEEAAPGHVDLVRRLFFGGLPDGLAGPLSEVLESVYANIIKHGCSRRPSTGTRQRADQACCCGPRSRAGRQPPRLEPPLTNYVTHHIFLLLFT